jgi:putative FmdB family regulatory protein
MPTYVYACDTCRVEFEKFQSFKDEPLRTCPTCDSAVRRVLQPAGIVFKGSGWHITDYRAQSGGSSTSSESTASASTAADSAASSAPAADSAASSAPATSPTPSSTGSDSAVS